MNVASDARMPTLADQLGTEPKRQDVIAESVDLIDAQVKEKGFVVRAAYSTIKALKRNIVPEVVDSLLDQWLVKLQPHHDAWVASGQGTFGEHLLARADVVADDLLSVTDARAAKTSKATARKLYAKLRDTAKRNVIEALPALSLLIERNMLDQRASATA